MKESFEGSAYVNTSFEPAAGDEVDEPVLAPRWLTLLRPCAAICREQSMNSVPLKHFGPTNT
jgi:hypothetical protein